MTFGEAWVAMEQGKKVVRPEWKESVYYLRDKKIIEYDTSEQKEYEHEGIEIFGDEVFENDWEIGKVEKTSEELKKENEKLKKENEELKLMVEKSKYKIIQMCNEIEKLKVQIDELIDEQPIQEQ